MAKFIIDKRNTELEYSTDCIVVRTENEALRTIPLGQITQLLCMHNVRLSTQLIGQLQKRGIDLIVINQRFHTHSFSLFADNCLQLKRRLVQYELQRNTEHRLPLIKKLCSYKFKRIERELSTHFGQSTNFAESAKMSPQADNITEQQIRGIEGALQQRVFEVLRQYASPALGFTSRNRRPPKDPVNAVLSLSYVMAYHLAIRHAISAGLDSRLGFYHRLSHGRHSLACDLIEPLRPQIKSWVIFLFYEGILHPKDFSRNSEACLLGKPGRLRYYEALDYQIPLWNKQLKAIHLWLVKYIDLSLLTNEDFNHG